MPKYYACDANYPQGEAIEPVNRSRIQEGRYYVPDCPDYDSKFGLARRVKLKAVYAGWSCFNCSHLLEGAEPFSGPRYDLFKAQRGMDNSGGGSDAAAQGAADRDEAVH